MRAPMCLCVSWYRYAHHVCNVYLVANAYFENKTKKMPPKNTSSQVELKMKELEGLVYKLTYLIEPYFFLKDRSEESEIHAAPVPAGSA